MARAMSASGDLKPNPTRVSRRILVLTASTRPLDRPWVRAAWMSARCRAIALASLTKAGMRQRLAQASHAWSSTVARTPLSVTTSPGFFLQQVGAVQAVVDLGDPGELGPLGGGQVAGVLPQRIAGTLELARQGSLPVLAGRVPHLAAHLVQRVGGPLGRRGMGPGRAAPSGSARRPRSRSRG